jgi:hypothetical protein
MPRETLLIQIFIASPSDVAEERAIVDSVVAELNTTWTRSLGVSFEIVKWETNVRPGFSEDPQTVIREQISPDYDVFLGIFWTRIGTATLRAESGSVEEFDQAYARFKKDGVPEIMMYFKDAPVAPSKISGDQIKAVAEFKARLSSLGGLTSTFEDTAGFEASLRAHISAIGQKFASATRARIAGAPNTSAPGATPSIDSTLTPEPQGDDFGLLDYMDVFNTRMSDMTLASTTIGEATKKLGEQLSHRSVELTSASGDISKMKRSFKLAAGDMNSFSETTNAQVILLAAARKEAFDALSNAVAIAPDFPSELPLLAGLRGTLFDTISTIDEMKVNMIGMQTAASSLPRVNQDLNRGKRAVSESVQKFLTELDSVQSTVRNLIESLDRLLPGAP